MTGFFTAPKIAWGDGAVEQLSGLGAERAFVIVDPTLHGRGAHRRILEELAKTDTALEEFHEVPIEPTVASVEDAVARFRSFHPDWIVAVGGGSTLDYARAVWARAAAPNEPLERVTPLLDLPAKATARFVAMPSTTGSGSEASWVAHLHRGDGRILEVAHRELLPDWALLDPSLPASMPPKVAAESGADLIAHALEAAVSEWSNPMSDACAREALGTAVACLPRVARRMDDPESRERLQCAATLAGLAVSNAQPGIVHAMAHALGGAFRLPHGRLVAALLPYAVEFNYPSAREKYLALAPVLGAAAVQHRSALPEKLRSLFEPLGLPRTLADAGVTRDEFASHRDELIESVRASSAIVGNPRIPSSEETGRLLDAALQGESIGF